MNGQGISEISLGTGPHQSTPNDGGTSQIVGKFRVNCASVYTNIAFMILKMEENSIKKAQFSAQSISRLLLSSYFIHKNIYNVISEV